MTIQTTHVFTVGDDQPLSGNDLPQAHPGVVLRLYSSELMTPVEWSTVISFVIVILASCHDVNLVALVAACRSNLELMKPGIPHQL